MASKRIEDYAFKHGCSNNKAKKRIGHDGKTRKSNLPARGVPIAGTGKPKGE